MSDDNTNLPTVQGSPGDALVLYDDAVKAIVACKTLIQSKYWMDFAEAKTLLGKMTKDRRVEVEGKRLRLLAHRRASELADRLRPTTGGHVPGARSLLTEQGFSASEANTIRSIGVLSKKKFDQLINSPRPPSPTTFATSLKHGSQSWKRLSINAGMSGFAAYCNRNSAKSLARGLVGDEAEKGRELVGQISIWLDEFERYIPKAVERK